MINGKKLVVVLPAFNAGRTLAQTYQEIPADIVDDVILVDDKSLDHTVEIARKLKIEHVIQHDSNRGYGSNQKTCPTRYFEDASSIKFGASIRYGLGVLRVSLQHVLHRAGIMRVDRYAK